MKKGQIILGVAYAIIAVGSGLAFRAAHKFSRHPIYGKTSNNGSACEQCRTYFTGTGFFAGNCKTNASLVAPYKTLYATIEEGKAYFFTQVEDGTCAGTHVNTVSKTD